jgi:hypothetical protein
MSHMKNMFKYIGTSLIVLSLASCDDFLDVNIDPNNPTSVTPDLVLPVGQNYTAQIMQNNRRINNLGNMMMYNWSQSDGYSWYPDEFKYLVNTSFYQEIFENTYSNALKQYQVLDQLTDEKYVNYKAIGMIMKAYHFQLLVDLYGDVPYTEALQRSNNATPKYDDAKTIYEDLIVKLSEAIDLIKNAENADEIGAADAMFKGDMQQWIKFANTLKLRILVRQSSMAGRNGYIQEKFAEIVEEGSGFITKDVGVNPGYLAKEEDRQNPMWNTFGEDAAGTQTMNNKATCATDYVLQYLTATADPRIDFIYEKPSTGHLGVPQGLLDYDTPVVDAFTPDKVSNIGPGILKSGSMDAIILTLAESYFNLAEAKLKGLITIADTDKDLYEKGIKASFDYLKAPGYTDYYRKVMNLVGYDASSNKLQAIITQKWIATNGINAEQSWFDYSRTGYPAGLPISDLATTSDRPVRLFYPASEISSNGANVPAQPDAFTVKIFWAN